MRLGSQLSPHDKSPNMDADTAARIVIRPYVTERTFSMVETNAVICFLVERTASKRDIAKAIKVLYGKNVIRINTTRTIYGKKAFVKFDNAEHARDLATDVGMI